MNFNRWLNIIHLSGLKKICVTVLLVLALLLSYSGLYFKQENKNENIISNFRSAFNEGNYADYLTADSVDALTAKVTTGPQELLLRALQQGMAQSATFDLTAGNDNNSASVISYFSSEKVLPLFFKELNDSASSLTKAAQSLLATPADESIYHSFIDTFKSWLNTVVKDKTKANLDLQTVSAASWLPGLSNVKVELSNKNLQLLSGDIVAALAKEESNFKAVLQTLIGASTAETTVADNEETTLTTATESGETAVSSESSATDANKQTVAATETEESQAGNSSKPGNQAANGAATAATSAAQAATTNAKPVLPTRPVNADTAKVQANSRVPAVGAYYAVKKTDTIYSMAEAAYAAKYDDFAANPDKYIEMLINYNKLTVRNNTVYLLEQQVIYFPAP